MVYDVTSINSSSAYTKSRRMAVAKFASNALHEEIKIVLLSSGDWGA